MDPFCKLYGTTDLASLHYVTFIEPFAVLPMDALSFDSEQFTNNGPFLLLKEHFFAAILLHKKTYEVQFEDLSHEVLKFLSAREVSAKRFVHNNFYHNKFMLIIFLLQTYILKVT
jgi:hypothetical protein